MKKAKATPTKDFFVRMITRDISLEDSLLDLIDNCLDGARRTATVNDGDTVDSYAGFCASLRIGPDEFTIEDNCGGISISNAIDYAFHFGRRRDAPDDADFAIGLYGIGMKRAIFKIGSDIGIHSSTPDEAFRCTILVDDWLRHDRWEFDMDDAALINGTGTAITIRVLNNGIADEFGDAAFVNKLVRIVSRDYTRFIEKGFKIRINGAAVRPRRYTVKTSEEFQPYRIAYKDKDVDVEILAGMAAPPPNDIQPSDRARPEYFGWFVYCNDRVVLAADKSERTVWGNEGFTRWHQQYNGFLGMVLFHSSDPNLLPWTTTKRDVDENSALYRRALKKMKIATQPWVEYTNQRKADLEEAKKKERDALVVPLFGIEQNPVFRVPVAPGKASVPMAHISYQKGRSEVREAGKALGNAAMSYKDIGKKTFEYFMKYEVGEGE